MTDNKQLIEFYEMIGQLKESFPDHTPNDLGKLLKLNLPVQLNMIKKTFTESMKDVPKDDKEYINMLIALNEIGISFDKEKVMIEEIVEGDNEGDEGDNEGDEGDNEGDEGEDICPKIIYQSNKGTRIKEDYEIEKAIRECG